MTHPKYMIPPTLHIIPSSPEASIFGSLMSAQALFDTWYAHYVTPLRELLEGAKQVTGYEWDEEWGWGYGTDPSDTHTAWLIGVQPIKPKSELDTALEHLEAVLGPNPLNESEFLARCDALQEAREFLERMRKGEK